MTMSKPKREFKLLKTGPASFYVKWCSNRSFGSDDILVSSTGFKMIKVCCTVTDGAGQEEDVTVNFTENGLMFLSKLLHCLGIPRNYSPEMVLEDPDLLEGRQGDCILSHETYEGKTRNKIATFVRKLDGAVALRESTAKSEPAPFNPDEFDSEIPF